MMSASLPAIYCSRCLRTFAECNCTAKVQDSKAPWDELNPRSGMLQGSMVPYKEDQS